MSNIDTIATDVLIIGGGTSGLAAAIHLAELFKQKGQNHRILLIEKGSSIGSHILSGSLIKPDVFKELLPEVELSEIPFNAKVTKDNTVFLKENSHTTLPFHIPYMNNMGNYAASLSQICKYLAVKAAEKRMEIYTGFAFDEILYKDGKVLGAKTKDTGLDHHCQFSLSFWSLPLESLPAFPFSFSSHSCLPVIFSCPCTDMKGISMATMININMEIITHLKQKIMNTINIKRFGLAFGLTGAVLYLGCVILMVTVGHEGSVKFFNSILHGLDTSSFIRMQVPWREALIGLVETFILGWLVGACIACFYNISAKR